MKRLIVLLMLISSPVFAKSTKDTHKRGFNFIGLKVDAGIHGLGFGLVGKPVKFMQFELAGTTTLVGGGVKAGMQIMVPWYLSPGLLVEGGANWAGNLNKLVVLFGYPDPRISLLDNVSYNYANFYGTLGFGHPNWFMFNLYAGYTYITGTTNGLQAYIQSKMGSSNVSVSEAKISTWFPSAKVALTFYF